MSTVYLHHSFLHFPIALFILAGILAAFSLFRPSRFISDAVLLLLGAGLLTGLVAGISGLLSAGHLIEEGEATASVVAGHRNAALLALLFALASFLGLWRVRVKDTGKNSSMIVVNVLAILAAILITVAGDRGGRMIHPSVTPFEKKHTHAQSAELGDPHAEMDADHHAGETSDHEMEPEHGEEEHTHDH